VNAVRRLVVAGALIEAVIGALAFAMAGLVALAATLAGSGIAFGAQVAAVALLRPAMQERTPQFTQRWALGMAIRFGSFLAVAAVIVAAKAVLPPAWVAAGYLSMMLVLLVLETRFLT
jgi:hypothetical protein